MLAGHPLLMADSPQQVDRRTPKSIEFEKRVARAREQKVYTQAELADMLGVTENAVAQYEGGRATPKPARLDLLAKVLGVSMTWLLTGNEPEELTRAQTAGELSALDIIRTIPLEHQPIALAALRGIAEQITKK